MTHYGLIETRMVKKLMWPRGHKILRVPQPFKKMIRAPFLYQLEPQVSGILDPQGKEGRLR